MTVEFACARHYRSRKIMMIYFWDEADGHTTGAYNWTQKARDLEWPP